MKSIIPAVPFEVCPIRASLGVLGRKWALLVLRDVAFFREVSFSQMLRNSPGMTPRVLSMRLKELTKEGIIERMVSPRDPREIRYRLTARGKDVIPILTAFIQFGIHHHAERVFKDERPRTLQQVFPGRQPEMLGALRSWARRSEMP